MALYTIGDLHLSLFKEKPMDIFGDKGAIIPKSCVLPSQT